MGTPDLSAHAVNGLLSPISIRVLGQLSVGRPAEGRVAPLDSRTQARTLLALLAGSRDGVTRDELTNALWPNHDDHAARNRLHHTVHLARQCLAALTWSDEWVISDRNRLRLDPRVDCDAWHVQDAACSASLTEVDSLTLMQALELCQGEWAPDVDAGGLGQTIRRQIKEWHFALQHEAARRLGAEGDTPGLRRALERLLGLNGTDEWAHRKLMELDFEAGRYQAVLRRFQDLSHGLATEFGLRPSEPSAAIAERAAIRLSSDGSGGAGMEQPSPLLGRQPLVHELCAGLQAKGGLWNIHGLGGMGKTAFIHEVARRVGHAFKDGVFIINSDHRVPGAMARALQAFGLPPLAPADAASAVTAAVEQREALVVFDNLCESSELWPVLPLLARTAGCRVVAITKRPLGDGHSTPIALPPLSTPTADASWTLAQHSPAVAMFTVRRTIAQADTAESDHSSKWVRLVRALAGWPLAIDLAASRADTVTTSEILSEVESGMFLDWAATPAHPAGQAGVKPLRQALDDSHCRLSPQAQRLYAAMAVFPGAFSVEDLEPVAAAAGTAAGGDMACLLSELRCAGLLFHAQAESALQMPHPARVHARSLPYFASVRTAAAQVFLQHLAAQLSQGEVGHESPRYLQWMDQVFRLHDRAVASLPLAQSLGDEALLSLLLPLMRLWSVRLTRNNSSSWLKVGLAAALRQRDSRAEMIVRTHATRIYLVQADLEAALWWSQPLKDMAERHAADCEDSALALSAYLRSLHLARPSGDHLGMAKDWLCRWGDESTPGHYTILAALGRLQQEGSALDIGRVPEFDNLRARFSGSLVWVSLLLSSGHREPQVRLQVGEELLAISRTARSPLLGLRGLMFQASALDALGRYAQLQHVLHSWYRLACAQQDHPNAAAALAWRAEFAWRSGALADAARHLDEAGPLFATLRRPTFTTLLQCHQLVLSLLRDDVRGAVDIFLNIGRHGIGSLALEGVELAVESAALLAQALQELPVAKALVHALNRLNSSRHGSPVTRRFRQAHFGWAGPEAATPVPGAATADAPPITPEARATAPGALTARLDPWPEAKANILALMRSQQMRATKPPTPA